MQKKKQKRKTIGYPALSQYCLGCVLVCPIRCFKLLFLSTLQWFRASNCLLRLLWSKLRQLGDCAANCLFVLFFPWTWLSCSKLLLLQSLTLPRTSDLKTMSLVVSDYLCTRMGCFQCKLFPTFDPVTALFFLNWGYSSWDSAIKSTRNL